LVTKNTTTVENVKKIIEAKLKIPENIQRLIWNTRQLEDHRTLESYKMPTYPVIHVVGRLRGD